MTSGVAEDSDTVDESSGGSSEVGVGDILDVLSTRSSLGVALDDGTSLEGAAPNEESELDLEGDTVGDSEELSGEGVGVRSTVGVFELIAESSVSVVVVVVGGTKEDSSTSLVEEVEAASELELESESDETDELSLRTSLDELLSEGVGQMVVTGVASGRVTTTVAVMMTSSTLPPMLPVGFCLLALTRSSGVLGGSSSAETVELVNWRLTCLGK